jgi:hypothetical protein
LTAAGDLEAGSRLDSLLADPSKKPARSLDDVLADDPKPKPEWPSES